MRRASKTIAALFDHQVSRTPDNIALRCGSQTLTFAALSSRANQLERQLVGRGIRPGDRVAIAMPHSPDLVAAYIAIIKAGATYVGIEQTWPRVRRRAVIDDSGSKAVVTVGSQAGDIAPYSGEIVVPDDDVRWWRRPSAANPEGNASEHRHAIVYTSGTTGRPNGVVITSESVLNRLNWIWRTHRFRESDVTLLHTSCATISFPLNCLGAMLRGVTTVIATAEARDVGEITGTAIEGSVSCMSASPGFWEAILDELELRRKAWPSLRLARTGGEQLRPEFVRRWYQVFPSVPILNVYGATESSTSAAYDTRAFRDTGDARVPVGRPVQGVELYVLDSALRPSRSGAIGEIYIGGASLAEGYLDRPALTAERFVAHPLKRGDGARLFRTGDLGVRRQDGGLEITGRLDEQIKVRGFRIEIGEIEAELRRVAGVGAAAVVTYGKAPVSPGLAAHIELNAPLSTSIADVRASLAQRLPSHMVPALIVIHAHMPRTASGKVDKAQLRNETDKNTARTYVAPRTQMELVLCTIWRSVLCVDAVGVEDDFFELGGHSLSAMQIVSRINGALDRDIGVVTVFNHPTVRLLAATLDAGV